MEIAHFIGNIKHLKFEISNLISENPKSYLSPLQN